MVSFALGPIPFAQPIEQGFRFQFGRFLQFLFHFRPVCFKRVATGSIVPMLF